MQAPDLGLLWLELVLYLAGSGHEKKQNPCMEVSASLCPSTPPLIGNLEREERKIDNISDGWKTC